MSSVKIYTAVSEDLSPLIQGEGFCTDMVRYSDYAALELRCAALAAENVALLNPETWIEKSAEGEIASAIADGNGESEESSLLAGMRAIIDSIDTPATDAWLAEVRSQGVEMFAHSLKVVGEHEHPYSAVAKEFAAQLRQGGAA